MDIECMTPGVKIDRAVADAIGFRVQASFNPPGYALCAPGGKPIADYRPTPEKAWTDLPYHFSTDFYYSLSALESVSPKYRIERTPDQQYSVQVTIGNYCPPNVITSRADSLPLAICRAILKGTALS